VRIQAEPVDTAAEIAAMSGTSATIGAIVTFSGLCRDEGGRLSALEIEHYPGMAESQIGRIANDAARRWPLSGLDVIHRHGTIHPGETIVLVVAASTHRDAAFQAASFLMDYLKTSAPFWKREHLADGTVGEWVEAKESDELAMARWDGFTQR
jgi:molybdopterin synthase catalytic subunit